MITVRHARWPKRRLPLKRSNHGGVILPIDTLIQCAKTGLVRHELCERDLGLPAAGELRPENRNAPLQLDPVFLQDMQKARAAEAFRGRPEEHERIGVPWHLAPRVPITAMQ